MCVKYANMKKSLLVLALLFGRRIQAQEITSPPVNAHPVGKSLFNHSNKREKSRQGDWFFHWGYNFSWYDKSDISFKGPGYDFKLKDVVAHDRPSKLSLDYINPMEITIPQFNFRFGYFFKDNYSLSLGWDHMKYVMDIPQKVVIEGYINPSISEPAIPTGNYAGVYEGQELQVNEEMLSFEHTDGLNYVSAELERYDDIWYSRSHKNGLTLETGIGLGFVIPRSDVHLFGIGKNNFWNFAGYGVSVKAGLKFYLTRRLYLQNTTKTGFMDLPKIHTTGRNNIDGASQTIRYIENFTALGYQF